MRVLILALSILGILVIRMLPKPVRARPIRNLPASVDPATFTDEATSGNQKIRSARQVEASRQQRGLTGLGFDI